MCKKIYFICFICFSISISSQTQEEALKDAKTTAKAALELDFNTVLNHTLPSIIELIGGKEKAKSLIKTTFDSMKKQGFVFEKSEVKQVSKIIQEQGQYRCYVENFNQIKMPNMRIKSKSYLLGIYDEKGKKWWFLEAERMKNKTMLEQILPNFKSSLIIPKDETYTEKI